MKSAAPFKYLKSAQRIPQHFHVININWISVQIYFDLLLAFQLLRNDSITQISESTSWRQHFGSDQVHPRHIIMYINGTNTSLHRVHSSFFFFSCSIIRAISRSFLGIALHIPTAPDFTRDWHVRIKKWWTPHFYVASSQNLSSYNKDNQEIGFTVTQ